ncbi:hypothetical protein THOM_0534 [Trachipleistophora hominis]|uniref:Uncharacterized protein n=1 Tax=Trachipleistophora hominis TaxID=72359 RepID=L7JZM7_TRAHO|nr:hypothetical protein THOM_0534 [Trachipleistophora hominis]
MLFIFLLNISAACLSSDEEPSVRHEEAVSNQPTNNTGTTNIDSYKEHVTQRYKNKASRVSTLLKSKSCEVLSATSSKPDGRKKMTWMRDQKDNIKLNHCKSKDKISSIGFYDVLQASENDEDLEKSSTENEAFRRKRELSKNLHRDNFSKSSDCFVTSCSSEFEIEWSPEESNVETFRRRFHITCDKPLGINIPHVTNPNVSMNNKRCAIVRETECPRSRCPLQSSYELPTENASSAQQLVDDTTAQSNIFPRSLLVFTPLQRLLNSRLKQHNNSGSKRKEAEREITQSLISGALKSHASDMSVLDEQSKHHMKQHYIDLTAFQDEIFVMRKLVGCYRENVNSSNDNQVPWNNLVTLEHRLDKKKLLTRLHELSTAVLLIRPMISKDKKSVELHSYEELTQHIKRISELINLLIAKNRKLECFINALYLAHDFLYTILKQILTKRQPNKNSKLMLDAKNQLRKDISNELKSIIDCYRRICTNKTKSKMFEDRAMKIHLFFSEISQKVSGDALEYADASEMNTLLLQITNINQNFRCLMNTSSEICLVNRDLEEIFSRVSQLTNCSEEHMN